MYCASLQTIRSWVYKVRSGKGLLLQTSTIHQTSQVKSIIYLPVQPTFKTEDLWLRLYRGGGDSPQPTLYRLMCGFFWPLSTDGVAKEGHPKFNPQPDQGLNPGPSGYQSEILPTVPTSHTFTISYNTIPYQPELIKTHLHCTAYSPKTAFLKISLPLSSDHPISDPKK